MINDVNKILVEMLKRRKAFVIDLNPIISRHGVLLEQFTTDGVHFSYLAYRVWANEILSTVAKSTDRSFVYDSPSPRSSPEPIFVHKLSHGCLL